MTPKITINTSGNTDLEPLFEMSGIRADLLTKNPCLAFVAEQNEVRVELVSTPQGILGYPDETPILVHWPSVWDNNYYQFTAGDFRNYIANHPKSGSQTI